MAREPLNTGLQHTPQNAAIAASSFAIAKEIGLAIDAAIAKQIDDGVMLHPHAIGLGVGLAFMGYVSRIAEVAALRDLSPEQKHNSDSYIAAIYNGFITAYTLNNPSIQNAVADARLMNMETKGSA